jgi:hypothetical protein
MARRLRVGQNPADSFYTFLRMAASPSRMSMTRQIRDVLPRRPCDGPLIMRITSRRITRDTKPKGLIRALARRYAPTISKARIAVYTEMIGYL